jgi:hypothetical protein
VRELCCSEFVSAYHRHRVDQPSRTSTSLTSSTSSTPTPPIARPHYLHHHSERVKLSAITMLARSCVRSVGAIARPSITHTAKVIRDCPPDTNGHCEPLRIQMLTVHSPTARLLLLEFGCRPGLVPLEECRHRRSGHRSRRRFRSVVLPHVRPQRPRHDTC